jgi:T-complex protein 1 subunit zeta
MMKKNMAFMMNINAGKGLVEVMKSNLGPKGTIKMLVGGAGQIKMTKDGNTLLHEMQIQHPTAAMIARCSVAQDESVGDGTTSNVLLIGELLKQAEQLLYEGVHPRVITEGYELAKNKALEILEEFKEKKIEIDSTLLRKVAQTSLSTKVQPKWSDLLTPIVTEAVEIIHKQGEQIDLHMVEIMPMMHKHAHDSRLVRGLVLDHGGRHPGMPKQLKNCYILTLNVSLEYEKTEVHSAFYFSNAEQRNLLIQSERSLVDEKVHMICEFKRKVCKNGESFVVINQKGIDPESLEIL